MDTRVMFLFFLLNIIYVSSSPRLVHYFNKRAHTYCGKKLSEQMALVCNGMYNGPNKKSVFDASEPNDFFQMDNSDEENEIDFHLMPKDAKNWIIPMRYRRQKISEECCLKPCTLDQMSEYCAYG